MKEKIRDSHLEPMKTLITYRKFGNKVLFGSLFNIKYNFESNFNEVEVEIGDIKYTI